MVRRSLLLPRILAVAALLSPLVVDAAPPATPVTTPAAAPAPPAATGTSVAPANAGEAEAQKCEDRIASVQRDLLNKYETALQEMQAGFQKSADLEGALAVRQERQRLAQNFSLAPGNYVSEPKALRALQTQMVTRQQELVSQLVEETVPRLAEFKRQLTVAGRLDEAVVVRAAIERLQTGFNPATPPAAGSLLQADVVLKAYGADRGRADAMYKNQRITVHGLVAGFRADPDGRHYLIYVAGTTTNLGLIQCSFATNDIKFKEDTQFGTPVLVASWGNGSTLKLQRGSAVDLSGQGGGFEETARMIKCEFVR